MDRLTDGDVVGGGLTASLGAGHLGLTLSFFANHLVFGLLVAV